MLPARNADSPRPIRSRSRVSHPTTVPLLLLATLFLGSCGHLPSLTPVDDLPRTSPGPSCLACFPQEPWKATYAMHITGPFGFRGSVIGVTVADPARHRLHAVMLSLEGMVLFDASYENGKYQVHRAVPPLDHEGFPEGLLHDVSLMFLPPDGRYLESGRNSEGHLVCRWRNSSGGTTDVVVEGNNSWQVLEYGNKNRLKREVQATGNGQAPPPPRIRFTCRGLAGYSLDLERIE